MAPGSMALPKMAAISDGAWTGVVFQELADPAAESQLWKTERVRHTDLNRLPLRSLEAILNPAFSAADIISAVAYGVTSQGLRVTQRDERRIVAQRIEAPYLTSFSSSAGGLGRRSSLSSSGAEREEWRVVVATLGVSKGIAGSWKGVERVLLLSFMTDPCPKQSELAARGAAAVTSLRRFGAAASAAASAASGLGGPSSSKDGSSTSSASPLSAVAIANLRSIQRADALVEAVVAELDQLGCGADPSAVGGVSTDSIHGGDASRDVKGVNTACLGGDTDRTEELALAPYDGSGKYADGVAPSTFSSGELIPEVKEDGGGVNASRLSLQKTEGRTALAGVPGGARDGAALLADAVANTPQTLEVRLCLQFVEGLCARAEENSRCDAFQTWKPLEEALRQLEQENAKLRSLLEIKYQAVGVVPPPVPILTGLRSISVSYVEGPGADSLKSDGVEVVGSAGGSGGGASRRIVALLQSSPLFVIEGPWVKARVVVVDREFFQGGKDVGKDNDPSAASPSSVSNLPQSPASSFHSSSPSSSVEPTVESEASATTSAATRRDRLSVQTAVRGLAEMISSACEAREEEFLKARVPGAQKYLADLEEYRSAIVRGKPLRVIPADSSDRSGQKNQGNAEIDDDLWRLFAAQETRLYSSPAALGKKPGRIFLTFNTLWFHSKVFGFESRHILPLAEVHSVALLGTALDISSSLVLSTRNGGEVMLVFPGQRFASLQPLEILVRQLAVVAAQEAEEVPLSGSVDV